MKKEIYTMPTDNSKIRQTDKSKIRQTDNSKIRQIDEMFPTSEGWTTLDEQRAINGDVEPHLLLVVKKHEIKRRNMVDTQYRESYGKLVRGMENALEAYNTLENDEDSVTRDMKFEKLNEHKNDLLEAHHIAVNRWNKEVRNRFLFDTNNGCADPEKVYIGSEPDGSTNIYTGRPPGYQEFERFIGLRELGREKE